MYKLLEYMHKKAISRRDFFKLSMRSLMFFPIFTILKSNLSAATSFKKGLVLEKEAMFYKKISDTTIQCLLCPNKCVLKQSKRSPCLVREVRAGKLVSLSYANPTSIHVDPIEKKPLFHFYPGQAVLSLATAGCNFSCLNCQNWQISQSRPEDTYNMKMYPKNIIDAAESQNVSMLAYTYSEPTVFYEYMYEIAQLAKSRGIKNISVTNGYINPAPLKKISKYIDAANVDLKGFDDEFYRKISGGHLKPVLNTMKILKSMDVHLEITNLIIPGYNDSETMLKDMCGWIIKELGADVPLHFSRFFPHYRFQNLNPTPNKTLIKARDIAREKGLKYVYIGNVADSDSNDTYCHNCSKKIIERSGYRIKQNKLDSGRCPYCNTLIPGVWI